MHTAAATDSEFLNHIPCTSCGSSDAAAVYTDGHTYCHRCGAHSHGDGEIKARAAKVRQARGLVCNGQVKELKKRNISEDTCRKFGYQVGEFQGTTVHIAPYFNRDGEVVAQKIRFPDKDFRMLGDPKEAMLFGSQLWGKGKKLVITEGEIDAMSVSQVQGNKWPVVSIPNGASGARKALKANLDYLEGFEEIILMFDMDDPGKQAALECAELLPPGKVKIAALSMKDPNELLTTGRGQEIISAIWNAKEWRPDGIVAGADLLDLILTRKQAWSVPYPYPGLNAKLRGLRLSEIVTLTSGSGMGKSTMARELAHWLIDQGETVGMLMLEESVDITAIRMLGISMSKPLHLSTEGIDPEEIKTAFSKSVGSGRLYLYDHFGSSEVDNILNRVRYMARALDCKWIILDHISILVSGMADGDERRLIDNAMTALRTLVQELEVGMILVSHLKRPEGKGHEEGAKTSLSQLRGSAAIGQLSDAVIGFERDQQHETDADFVTVRILKNRFTGDTGEAGTLYFDRDTGRLCEAGEQQEAEFNEEAPCPF